MNMSTAPEAIIRLFRLVAEVSRLPSAQLHFAHSMNPSEIIATCAKLAEGKFTTLCMTVSFERMKA